MTPGAMPRKRIVEALGDGPLDFCQLHMALFGVGVSMADLRALLDEMAADGQIVHRSDSKIALPVHR